MAEGLATTQRLLAEGVAAAAATAVSGRPDTSAFAELRKGVVRASSAREASPQELLGDLEPKGPVLRYLVDLHEQKSIYRKQIAQVFAILLQVNSWNRALREDEALASRLPEDLRGFLEETSPAASSEEEEERATAAGPPSPQAQAEAPQAPAPAAAAAAEPAAFRPPPWEGAGGAAAAAEGGGGAAEPCEEDVRAAIERARARIPSGGGAAAAAPAPAASPGPLAAGAGVEGHLALLARGRDQIAALGFSAAASGDAAAEAFEAFRLGVARIVASPTKEDDAVLEDLDDKRSILEFLVDFQDRRRKYASRVTVTLSQLLAFGPWRAAVEGDPSLLAELREYLAGSETSRGGGGGGGGSAGGGGGGSAAPREESDLLRMAARVVAQGGFGVLVARVVAAYGLRGGSGGEGAEGSQADFFVRAAVGSRVLRTEVARGSCDPRWTDEPFKFGVLSMDGAARFEVLQYDWLHSRTLGHVEVPLSAVPDEQQQQQQQQQPPSGRPGGRRGQRHALVGCEGELELELSMIFGAASAEPVDSPAAAGADAADTTAAAAASEAAPAAARGPAEARPAAAEEAPPPASPPPRESAVAPDEYVVRLTKQEGLKVGVHIEDGHLVVKKAQPGRGSLVEAWNAANPQAQARPGDVVVAVNGGRGNSRVLSDRVRGAEAGAVLELRLMRSEAMAKGRWMYADTWNHAIASLDPLRWSQPLAKDELLRELAARPKASAGRPVVVQIGQERHVCTSEEQVRMLFSVDKDLVPHRHLNAGGWPSTFQSAEVICQSQSEEKAFRAAEEAVRSEPRHVVCEVVYNFPGGWKAKRFVDAREMRRGKGRRHLVYAEAYAHREAFTE